MSLIKPEDTWSLMLFLVGWAALSIWLEQRYKWASTVSGAIIALIGAIGLANLKVIPLESPVYDAVYTYVLPVAVPMLLFRADLRRIWRESGRMFWAFNLSALGTILGAFIASFLVSFSPEQWKVAGMMTGSYIGGGVNFVALSAMFETSKQLVAATMAADNLNMAVYFLVLFAIPAIGFFRKNYPHPYEDKLLEMDKAVATGAAQSRAAAYWGRKEISLLDIAQVCAVAFVIATISVKIAGLINWKAGLYLIIATLTIALATVFPKLGELRGAQEIGTFLMYLFFIVIGTGASIENIVMQGPLVFVFCAIMVIVNMAVTLGLGKVFRFNLEELLIASNANVGGPTTAAAMAIAKGWEELVLPAILVGVWGYGIGNYLGALVGYAVKSMLGL